MAGWEDTASTEQDEKGHTCNMCIDKMHGLYLHAKIKFHDSLNTEGKKGGRDRGQREWTRKIREINKG